jgi:hypothetical protein
LADAWERGRLARSSTNKKAKNHAGETFALSGMGNIKDF